MAKKGIDISKYQNLKGPLDWAKVKGAVNYVMLRAVSTNNSGVYIDPYFEANYNAAKAAGIPVGVYYYTYAQTKAQADAELEMLRKALAGKSLEYPVAVDVEENSLKPLSKAALTDLVEYAVQQIESWHLYAMVYTYTYYQQTELDMQRLSKYDLWIADYRGTAPSIPHGMWQYSSKGRVPGIVGYVDCNYAYKDYPAIIKRAGLTGLAAEKPAAPATPAHLTSYKVGPVSAGDAARVKALASELGVPCVEV